MIDVGDGCLGDIKKSADKND
jgi:hypothetical protein